MCYWYREENAQHCTTKCNPGFEIPSRVNDFDYCGPSTGFTWNFQVKDPMAEMAPCIREYKSVTCHCTMHNI